MLRLIFLVFGLFSISAFHNSEASSYKRSCLVQLYSLIVFLSRSFLLGMLYSLFLKNSLNLHKSMLFSGLLLLYLDSLSWLWCHAFEIAGNVVLNMGWSHFHNASECHLITYILILGSSYRLVKWNRNYPEKIQSCWLYRQNWKPSQTSFLIASNISMYSRNPSQQKNRELPSCKQR